MTQAACKPSIVSKHAPKLDRGPAEPFSIGLRPLDLQDFLQIDDDLLPFRRAKQDLYQQKINEICKAEPDTLNSQREIETLIQDNLKQFHPALYDFGDGGAVCRQTGERIEQTPAMPIAGAALLIPDDLIIMRRSALGWRLVGAALAFPSSWDLAEKFSLPLEGVHGPVPMSDKMSDRINRIFDNLRPDTPLWRANWALDGNGELRHERREKHGKDAHKKLSGDVHYRTEFQTLHKLPQSNDILFSIRIKTRPITSLLDVDDGPRKLAILHRQYLEMSDEERDYKGINHNADELLNWLAENGSE